MTFFYRRLEKFFKSLSSFHYTLFHAYADLSHKAYLKSKYGKHAVRK